MSEGGTEMKIDAICGWICCDCICKPLICLCSDFCLIKFKPGNPWPDVGRGGGFAKVWDFFLDFCITQCPMPVSHVWSYICLQVIVNLCPISLYMHELWLGNITGMGKTAVSRSRVTRVLVRFPNSKPEATPVTRYHGVTGFYGVVMSPLNTLNFRNFFLL